MAPIIWFVLSFYSDEKVKVFKTSLNIGTYGAKTLALSKAQGEFVTCHDSDDWAHPQKVKLPDLAFVKKMRRK